MHPIVSARVQVLAEHREQLQGWLRPILRKARTGGNPNPKMTYAMWVHAAGRKHPTRLCPLWSLWGDSAHDGPACKAVLAPTCLGMLPQGPVAPQGRDVHSREGRPIPLAKQVDLTVRRYPTPYDPC